VALISPLNTTGLFELDVQPELLVPFEGIGVDTTWEFRMPRAANSFDYNTIADILVTLDYTALFSSDYQNQVLKRLERRILADRAYSFRYDFADPWYDLHNPELLDEDDQMIVHFRSELADFPAILENPAIAQVVLYFACEDPAALKITNANLVFTSDRDGPGGGDASPVEGKISTRANAWNAMIGKHPPGEWVLSFRPTDNDPNKRQKLEALKEIFKSEKKGEQIKDILLIISYVGTLPSWPD
jgi:hypothetical protein